MTSPGAAMPTPRKPVYRTLVVERHVHASRARVWHELVRLLDQGAVGPAAAGVGDERVLSLEAPWRRAARLDLPPLPLVEHTVAIRDDGDECHLVWAYLAEPGDADDTDPPLARLEAVLRDSIEQVATSAEAR